MRTSKSEKPAYRASPAETLKIFETSKTGLESAEAKKRLSIYGLNGLQDLKSEPMWQRYLRQYTDLIIVL